MRKLQSAFEITFGERFHNLYRCQLLRKTHEIEVNATNARKKTDESKFYPRFLVNMIEVDWAPYKQTQKTAPAETLVMTTTAA